MNRVALMLLVLGLLFACAEDADKSVVDQCVRERVFQTCLRAADDRPGNYEDIVAECDVSSILQAKRRAASVSPACLP